MLAGVGLALVENLSSFANRKLLSPNCTREAFCLQEQGESHERKQTTTEPV